MCDGVSFGRPSCFNLVILLYGEGEVSSCQVEFLMIILVFMFVGVSDARLERKEGA